MERTDGVGCDIVFVIRCVVVEIVVYFYSIYLKNHDNFHWQYAHEPSVCPFVFQGCFVGIVT